MTAPVLPPTRSLVELRARFGPRYRWWVLFTVMVGTIASIMSSTIVNVAIPDMSRVFSLGQERAQWMSSGFMAAMTISMLTTPWLLSRFGYRRTYAWAVFALLLGGIGGGCGQDYAWVMMMRVVEGLSSGVIQPIPAIIILRAFDRHEQGRAMGIFGMGVVLAPALGPSIGGLLVEHFGWRSIFFVVVPFSLLAIALARRYLPHSAPGGAPVNSAGMRFDTLGIVLVAIFIVTLLNGLVRLHDGAGVLASSLLAIAAIALVCFLAHQHRNSRALVNPALFGSRTFAMGAVVSLIYGMALFGSTYLVPVFMQMALALPPSQAGAVLLPAGLALAVTIPIAGRLCDRLPMHRLITTGLVLLAVSFVLMLGVGPGTALWVITLWAVIGRIGLGFVLPSLSLGAMRGLEADFISQGSSTIAFLRQLGGAVGVSLIGIFLEWRLAAHGAGAPGSSGSAGQLAAFHEAFAVLAVVIASATIAARAMKPRAS